MQPVSGSLRILSLLFLVFFAVLACMWNVSSKVLPLLWKIPVWRNTRKLKKPDDLSLSCWTDNYGFINVTALLGVSTIAREYVFDNTESGQEDITLGDISLHSTSMTYFHVTLQYLCDCFYIQVFTYVNSKRK